MKFNFSLLKNPFFLVQFFVVLSCSNRQDQIPRALFTSIHPSESGIDFSNNLKFDQKFNIYTYRNFYNGGGVALGDVNNDGLIDIYFSSNLEENKLYLNKGDFAFEDITKKAGVTGTKAWSTGVAMADVNGDGWIDIYVCNSGDIQGDNKQNELFINNGDLTFSEKGEAYRVADPGFSTHAAFFDYDRDNDLDLYILNNSYQAIGSFNLRKNERPKRDALGGHKLMRNDGDFFTDVSEKAGIYGSVIAFGLGVTVGDIDKDGWPDIYVSNDFFERDYLYINNRDGTFKECLTEKMKSISGASMGADMADINNDAYPDIFVTEMLPADNARIKTVTTFENWDRYQFNLQNDYYHQFTRNMLQLSDGNGSFSEIGRLAGVEATDWSWGALIFDMDNDGLKDIFVANGIYQDLTNQDYLQYVSSEEAVRSIVSDKNVNYQKLVELIPTTAVPDFAFHNQGDLGFINKAMEWGLGDPNFSNGSAYGDFDNDGDLDLVINRVNETASLFRNESDSFFPKNRYLKFELKGVGKNTLAIGTTITINHGNNNFYIEQMPNRGFESSVDHRPNLGLGKIDTVDLITLVWPDGKVIQRRNVATNQTLFFTMNDTLVAGADYSADRSTEALFHQAKIEGVDFIHKENEFVDFDRDKLIYHMLSNEGPRMTKGDINGDGLEDFYIGGAKDSEGSLYMQASGGKFVKTNEKILRETGISEDLGSVLFDADGDKDLDLYVCSGGNEFSSSAIVLIDRLYINNGRGSFTKSPQPLPTPLLESTSTVKSADYDRDGDQDLFVGVRLKPFLYGVPSNGYLLNNDGNGNFKDVTADFAPDLRELGMITDAAWADIDGDQDDDLVVVGEYMPVKVLINEGTKLIDRTTEAGLAKTNGWWNRIEGKDLDKDGDIDFVIGNHGLNSRFRATSAKPVSMYVNDFDQNGTVEQLVCVFNGEKSYPMALRHDLLGQMPSLKKKYLKYEDYKDQVITDIFSPEQMKNALVLEAFELSTCLLLNEGHGKFSLKALPVEAQLSPVFGIEIDDFDGDGHFDIILGGNFYKAKPEVGRYDAGFGLFLHGNGKNEFTPWRSIDSGLKIEGEVRDIISLTVAGENLVLIARNNDTVVAYSTKRK